MTTLENVTTGQTFTNGTTQTVFEYLGNNEAKNTVTGETITLTDDTHLYLTKKTYTDYSGNEVELTAREAELVDELDVAIFEFGAIVHLEDMELSYSTSIARGVLSSLIKKNVCSVNDGMIGYSMDKY